MAFFEAPKYFIVRKGWPRVIEGGLNVGLELFEMPLALKFLILEKPQPSAHHLADRKSVV